MEDHVLKGYTDYENCANTLLKNCSPRCHAERSEASQDTAPLRAVPGFIDESFGLVPHVRPRGIHATQPTQRAKDGSPTAQAWGKRQICVNQPA
jgi:hypothetical protein